MVTAAERNYPLIFGSGEVEASLSQSFSSCENIKSWDAKRRSPEIKRRHNAPRISSCRESLRKNREAEAEGPPRQRLQADVINVPHHVNFHRIHQRVSEAVNSVDYRLKRLGVRALLLLAQYISNTKYSKITLLRVAAIILFPALCEAVNYVMSGERGLLKQALENETLATLVSNYVLRESEGEKEHASAESRALRLKNLYETSGLLEVSAGTIWGAARVSLAGADIIPSFLSELVILEEIPQEVRLVCAVAVGIFYRDVIPAINYGWVMCDDRLRDPESHAQKIEKRQEAVSREIADYLARAGILEDQKAQEEVVSRLSELKRQSALLSLSREPPEFSLDDIDFLIDHLSLLSLNGPLDKEDLRDTLESWKRDECDKERARARERSS